MTRLRLATSEEQEAIDAANAILETVGLSMVSAVYGNGGAVIPSKGF